MARCAGVHQVGTLLREIRSLHTHDMRTDKHTVILTENELAESVGFGHCQRFAIGTEEALSSVRPTMPHSGTVNTADGTISKRISS